MTSDFPQPNRSQQAKPESHDAERPLRHAVIGVGASVFGMHRAALALETASVVAVSDVNARLGEERAEALGCAFFTDHRQLLAEVQPDVTVVLTPHPFHASISIDALEAGSHVLVEKPMAVHVGEADEMIEAADRNGRLLAVNFQHRLRPEVQAVRDLIQSGRLGTIQRVTVIEPWLRNAVYYRNSGGWRGTWRGEGGGLLLNQAPHGLDLVCHLLGSPRRLFAWTRTTRHAIETEDTAVAMLEWENGALGTIHMTTAEAGPRRTEIVGSAGQVILKEEGIEYRRYATGRIEEEVDRIEHVDLIEHIESCPEPFHAPDLVNATLAVEAAEEIGHVQVYRDLHRAILHGGAPSCDGRGGCMSLELANAMIYSSYTGRPVELPLDRARYLELLHRLQGKETTNS